MRIDKVEWDGEHITMHYGTFCTPNDLEISIDGIVYGSKEWRDKYIGKYWYQRVWRKIRHKTQDVGYYFENIWRAIKGQ
jgi:hypothetical protein